MTTNEKATLYDDYVRQSELLQRSNSKLKSEFPLAMPEDKQKTIDENNVKINSLVKKLEDLLKQG